MTQVSSTDNTQLARTLGLWAIVGLGLGYMTPTVVFDTFGIVSNETGGAWFRPPALALVVMVFTAISYGRMTQVFPSAGSAYTYTSETISPNLGFLIGWAALLDYLLLPLVNALIIRSYMYSFFPEAPQWLWVIVIVAAITGMCLFSMTNTSRVNMLLVVFEVVLIAVFLILAAKSLMGGMGNGTVFFHHAGLARRCPFHPSSSPGPRSSRSPSSVSTPSPCTPRRPRTPPRCRRPSCWHCSSAARSSWCRPGSPSRCSRTFPTSTRSHWRTARAPDRAHGGWAPVQDPAHLGGVRRHHGVEPGLARLGVAAALRHGPQRSRPGRTVLRLPSPQLPDPAYAIIFVGVVSLGAIPLNLDFVASLINFGALIAFTFVNLTVIAYFAWRRREIRGAVQIFRNIVLPLIGVGLTVLLWVHLSEDSTKYGIIWFCIGIGVLLLITRFFRRPLTVNMGETHPITREG